MFLSITADLAGCNEFCIQLYEIFPWKVRDRRGETLLTESQILSIMCNNRMIKLGYYAARSAEAAAGLYG